MKLSRLQPALGDGSEMDVERLAKRVVNESLQITKNDNVLIHCSKPTIDLAESLALECQKVGARASIVLYTDRPYYDLVLERPIDYLETPDPFILADVDVATILIRLEGIEDPARLEKISPERWAAARRGDAPINERLSTRHQGATIRLAQVTPQRAKMYGIDYEAWRENAYAAVDIDYGEMQRVGTRLRAAIERAEEIRITNAAGADLSAQIEGGQIVIDDGVLNRMDIRKGARFIEMPGGYVTVVPDMTSVNGTFAADTATPFLAKLIGGISWKFDRGSVVSFEGKENIGLMRDRWSQATAGKDKFGFIQFGLNLNARPGFLIDHIIRGSVTVGIGDNGLSGGVDESSISYAVTSVAATVRLDNKTIINKGKMAL